MRAPVTGRGLVVGVGLESDWGHPSTAPSMLIGSIFGKPFVVEGYALPARRRRPTSRARHLTRTRRIQAMRRAERLDALAVRTVARWLAEGGGR
jgi:hypothetical protein